MSGRGFMALLAERCAWCHDRLAARGGRGRRVAAQDKIDDAWLRVGASRRGADGAELRDARPRREIIDLIKIRAMLSSYDFCTSQKSWEL